MNAIVSRAFSHVDVCSSARVAPLQLGEEIPPDFIPNRYRQALTRDPNFALAYARLTYSRFAVGLTLNMRSPMR